VEEKVNVGRKGRTKGGVKNREEETGGPGSTGE
jgi:hypothetical protein